MDVAHDWCPIADYEVAPTTLAQSELEALTAVWREERVRVEASGALRRFNERLGREWAIETGLIERVYEFDRGITELMIDRGIDASLIPHGSGPPPELAASMIRDHEAAIEFLFQMVKDERPLSTSYIKELHVLLTRKQKYAEGRDSLGQSAKIALQHGDYKRLPNNPTRPDGRIHEYCPPEQVASEMERLIALHSEHREVAPEVEAAWLHHRFTQIHPFQDGNGRVARALATLVLIKAGRFPLVVRSSKKNEYLDALESADAGDLRPLIAFFSAIQRREFVRALGLSRTIDEAVRAEDLIHATKRELRHRRDALLREWETAKDRAASLQGIAEGRLSEVKESLDAEISPLVKSVRTFVDEATDHGDRSHFFRRQIIEGAKSLEYFANLDAYRAWVRLVIKNAHQSQILISFHGIGHEFHGVLVGSAVFFERAQTSDEDRETSPARALSDSAFQINYKEDPGSIEDRFRSWIEGCIVEGLRLWRLADL